MQNPPRKAEITQLKAPLNQKASNPRTMFHGPAPGQRRV